MNRHANTRRGSVQDLKTYQVTEYASGGFSDRQVSAIREIPLTIYLNDREVVTLLCTGKYPRQLALGFLKSDAFIREKAEIVDVDMCETGERITARVTVQGDPWEGRTVERSITSGCGKGTNFGRNVTTVSKRRLATDLSVKPENILTLVRELRQRSTLYGKTRGCHNSTLCTPDEMLLFREDIGRHNAIDMIVGHCFEEGIPTEDKMIVSTGRVASEILMKTVRIGVSVLVSTAVATSFSVELARKTGLTLVGNVTDDSFWIYNNNGRISGL